MGSAPQLKAWQPHCLLAFEGCFLSPCLEASTVARTVGQAGGQAELPAQTWWAVVVIEGEALEPRRSWAGGMENGDGCQPGKVCP